VILFWVLLACAAAMALVQDAIPGLALYHYGWYNAIDVALFAIAAMQLRVLRKAQPDRFTGLAIATFGCAIVVFAGVASGLMGPDTHTVSGVPGASVRDDDAGGAFAFPLQGNVVRFERGRSVVNIDGGRRYSGGFIFWQEPRAVVSVTAADSKGNHLTVTQPTNASFLSPVLLMQQKTTIAGMDVQFDTFSVPAMRRSVRAVLFTPEQAAQLHSPAIVPGKPAILFAVSDQQDRAIPGGIGVVASGTQRIIGGLTLGGTVETYPAIVVASGPYLPVLIVGLLCVLTGIALAVQSARGLATAFTAQERKE
jgi:hypothetical protein